MPGTAPEPAATIADPRGRLVLELGRALHEAGAPAHRLEAALDAVSRSLGIEVSSLSQPTSLILDLPDRTRVLRVEPAAVNLARMVAVDTIATEVSRGTLDVDGGLAALARLAERDPRYPKALGVVATAASAASAAVFFGASLPAVGVAALLGVLVGGLEVVSQAYAGYRRIHELATAFFVAAVATALGRVFPVSATLVTLAGIVSLLPGLSLTVALTELATRHLASGTARLTGAIVTLLQLGIGTALGWRLAALLPRALKPVGDPVPDALQWLVVPIAAAAFVVSFRARPRDYPWIVGVSLVAFFAGREGQDLLGPELGACIGGLVVGLLSNLQAVVRRVPTAVTQVPALILLVPGSVGFRGFGAMLNDDVTGGVDAGFRMLVVAGSLVAGTLAAGVLLPPRRHL
jgi:uncharacterized membrane protein YjjP (DUF1212 family)